IVCLKYTRGGSAELHRFTEYRVENRSEVTRGGVDDPQYLGGRGLLLARFRQLSLKNIDAGLKIDQRGPPITPRPLPSGFSCALPHYPVLPPGIPTALPPFARPRSLTSLSQNPKFRISGVIGLMAAQVEPRGVCPRSAIGALRPMAYDAVYG